MNPLAIWIGAAFVAASAMAQQDTKLEIRSLDARRVEALKHGDVQALDRILSADLVYTHASGWRQTKAEFLASIRSGELKYHTFAMHGVTMRVYGDTVVATGEASAKVQSKGQELDVSLLFVEVYAKQEGRWQLVVWQSTRSAP